MESWVLQGVLSAGNDARIFAMSPTQPKIVAIFKDKNNSCLKVAELPDKYTEDTRKSTFRIFGNTGETHYEADGVRFGKDGRRLVTVGKGYVVWDVDTEVQLYKFGDIEGTKISFSYDGHAFAFISMTALYLARLSDGKKRNKAKKKGK